MGTVPAIERACNPSSLRGTCALAEASKPHKMQFELNLSQHK